MKGSYIPDFIWKQIERILIKKRYAIRPGNEAWIEIGIKTNKIIVLMSGEWVDS